MAVGQELSREPAECACEMVGFQNAAFMWRLAGVRQHALSNVLLCPTLSLAYRCTNVLHMTAVAGSDTDDYFAQHPAAHDKSAGGNAVQGGAQWSAATAAQIATPAASCVASVSVIIMTQGAQPVLGICQSSSSRHRHRELHKLPGPAQTCLVSCR